MKSLFSKISKISRLLHPAQRGFRAARPGSVLILVVALLVLLALIGTAWMSSVRIERFASAQNIANVQIDLLVEGVKNIAQSVLVQDLFGKLGFKPYDSSNVYNAMTNANVDYSNDDWPTIDPVPPTAQTPGPADRHLASRLPMKLSNNAIVW